MMRESEVVNYNGRSEKSILRWGGLAGIAAFVAAILSLVLDYAFAQAMVTGEENCGAACYVDVSLSGFSVVKNSDDSRESSLPSLANADHYTFASSLSGSQG